MSDPHRIYINGEWITSQTGEVNDVTNPAAPETVVDRYQQSSQEDATLAVKAAADAQDKWAATPAPERGKYLREAAKYLDERVETIAERLTREEGKRLSAALGETRRAVDIFYYYAAKAADYDGTVKHGSDADKHLYTVREPMGVAGLITPWNYPIAIPAWKLAPALATGNTVVLKPANAVPGPSHALIEALDEADLPDGVINWVTGPGSEVGNAITTHEAVDAISFTGSRSVGDMVYDQATDDQKRVQTELGSKNPTVVMPSADLETAVDVVANGAFNVTGQACTSTDRALVHEDVHDEFVDHLVDHAEEMEIGPGIEDLDLAPQVNADEAGDTLDLIQSGREEGALLETGGGRPAGEENADGHFVEPTVFSGVDSDMRIAQEEVFGPVVAVIQVSDLKEAIDVTNDVEFGLTAGIVTANHDDVRRYVDEADFGVIKVNETTTGLEYHVPFGGMNASSSETFREQGEAGMDFFTISKTVYENPL